MYSPRRLAQMGRTAEATEALKKTVAIAPAAFNARGDVRERYPGLRPEDYDHMMEGLHKAGWQG